jgi:PilZ domain
MIQERRRSPRRTFNRLGRIYADAIGQRSCMIVNLSEEGARLCVEVALPEHFTLGIDFDGREERKACRVVWGLENEFGITFQD